MAGVFPPLYAILDPALTAASPLDLAVSLASAGVELIQFRDKRGSPRQIYGQAREIAARFASTTVRFVINDRPDIAAMCGAAGVHVGQDDLPVEAARAICRQPLWVGVSTHNLAQLRDAERSSADYIAVGPVFPTGTKANPDPIVGIDFIRAARQFTRKPLVAIGGITVESAAGVFAAGADSVAVIRDLVAAPDPAQRAREYLDIARRVRDRA